MPTITLRFADGDCLDVPARMGETVLAAAKRAGILLSSDCEVGDCQTCRATCLAGEVEYDEMASILLSQEEVDAGEILPCVTSAATDLEIRLPYERGSLIAAKPFSIKVEEVRRLGTSVVGIKARVIGLSPLKFLAGQYVHLQVPGTSEWRSYSMANAPVEGRVLEFFVRILNDGVMSRYLTDRAARGDVIQCRGPQGAFYLRSGIRPILMVAGGTGVAPMVSMLRQMMAVGERRDVTLLFGVTEASDLFLTEDLTCMARSFPGLDIQIAVTRGTAPTGIGSGLVTDLIANESLAGTDIYLCGPPAMIDRAKAVIIERAAVATSIFSERFLASS